MSLAVGIAIVLLVSGAAFVAVAALGLVRLPDVYLRMHSVAKAGTLGCGLILTGVIFALPEVGVLLRVVAAILFLLATAPVASHLLGRAAHRTGATPCAGTVVDQWAEAEDGAEDPPAAP